MSIIYWRIMLRTVGKSEHKIENVLITAATGYGKGYLAWVLGRQP